MSKHERMARIEAIDLATGTFTMTLATEGEASDGHILSIKGGQIPERMPMLNSHFNSPTETLGSITNPVKELKHSPPRLRAIGHIEMSGEGPAAEIRRDLAQMIDKGHVTGMSIRWDEVPGKTIRRVNLPSDHPHYVDSEKANGPERFGYFFEEWVAREGSVVALGADPGALIGRADQTEGAVSTFWRAMATEAIAAEPVEDLLELRKDDPPDESSEAKIAASLAALRIDAADCREAGASVADLINAVVDRDTTNKIDMVEIGDFVFFLPEPAAAAIRESTSTNVDLSWQIDDGTSATPADYPYRYSQLNLDSEEPEKEESALLDELRHLREQLEALTARLSALEGAEAEVSPASEPENDGREEVCEPPAQPRMTPSDFIDTVIGQLRAAHTPPEKTKNQNVVRPSEVVRALSRGLEEASQRVQEKRRAAIRKARGEIAT